MPIRKLLIANRGEIACRIQRTAERLGIKAVGVHSSVDEGALHVRSIGNSYLLGEGPAAESYLNIRAVLDAAERSGADAIHPGYGFLSEDPTFAEAVEAAGLIFVGPTAGSLRELGDKSRAKQAALQAGVPVIPGNSIALDDPREIADAAREMGLPVLLKAVGGGGGRGQRLVWSEGTLSEDIEAALREARNAFGSEGLLLERFIPEARHVEIQIAGDGTGNVLHLYERECSLQRRHQKVIEEAPAEGIARARLYRIAQEAVQLGEALAYRGLGTVEFLVTTDEHFFLEVNPRLQVEHPVTEMVTGVDLVELQLRIAAGEGLGLTQGDIELSGHAVEARIYAENPATGFAPSTGTLSVLTLPSGARVDTGVEQGDRISQYYDPMIAKIITHAGNRLDAYDRLGEALTFTSVEGVETNIWFLQALAADEQVRQGAVHTRLIDERLDELVVDRVGAEEDKRSLLVAFAASLWIQHDRHPGHPDPWHRRDGFTGWRLNAGNGSVIGSTQIRLQLAEEAFDCRVSRAGPDNVMKVQVAGASWRKLCLRERTRDSWVAECDGVVMVIKGQVDAQWVRLVTPEESLSFRITDPVDEAAEAAGGNGTLVSPLTGAILSIAVSEGMHISAGTTIAILESMKMELPIKATADGVLARLACQVGDTVERGQVIAELQESDHEVHHA